MTYRRLIAEHKAIEAAADVVVAIARDATPRVAEATRALEILATLLRDHLSGEEEAIFDTLAAAKQGRHAAAAARMGEELEQLKEDWSGYLYRWDRRAFAADWDGFAGETTEMLARINERVTFETTVLYSLAVHHKVIAAE